MKTLSLALTAPFILLLSIVGFSQQTSCTVYSNNDYEGNAYNLSIGQSVTFTSGNGVSFKTPDDKAALKVTFLEEIWGDNGGNAPYTNLFFYAENDQPFMTNEHPGLSQYKNVLLRAECLLRTAPPEPDIYVPIDGNSVAGGHLNLNKGHDMVILKRAFFWDNFEQIRGKASGACPEAHGPAGKLYIRIFRPEIRQHSFERLNIQDWQICNDSMPPPPPDSICYYNCHPGQRCFETYFIKNSNGDPGMQLYGPLFFQRTPNCPVADFFGKNAPPDSYNEWLDGPWGAVYSNIALFDWDENPQGNIDSILIGIVEGDGKKVLGFVGTFQDFLGGAVIRRKDKGEILIKIGAYGWIIVQNYHKGDTLFSTETEEVANHYWYPTWDGTYPEAVCGPLSKDTLEANENIGDFCLSEKINYQLDYPFIIDLDTGDSTFIPDSLVVVTNDNFTFDTISFYQYLLNEVNPYLTFMNGDTVISIAEEKYRTSGSQYSPYHLLGQVETFVPARKEVAVYSGIIPPGNVLTKPMTYVPLDPSRKRHQQLLYDTKSQLPTEFPCPGCRPEYVDRTQINPSALTNQRVKDQISIFPNPSTNQIEVSYSIDEAGDVLFTILSPTGTVIRSIKGRNSSPGNYTETFNIEFLQNGFYYLFLEGPNTSGIRQIGRFLKM